MRPHRAVIALLLSFGLLSCDDTPKDGTKPCDPVARSTQAVDLGAVLAVGRGADERVYVLDETQEGEVRAFVSDRDVLQRYRVLGMGSGSAGGIDFYDVRVDDDPDFTLYAELAEDGETRFTKITMEGRNMPDAAAQGEELELLSEGDLADLTLRNLPGDVTIEYFGVLEDERRVLVTRPTDDWSYDDFRVLLGPPDRVRERVTRSVNRQRDGGSTEIEITLDGEPAMLDFPVMRTGDRIVPGPATFEQGGRTLAIDLREATESALEELSFFCR